MIYPAPAGIQPPILLYPSTLPLFSWLSSGWVVTQSWFRQGARPV